MLMEGIWRIQALIFLKQNGLTQEHIVAMLVIHLVIQAEVPSISLLSQVHNPSEFIKLKIHIT